jgi:hypothetical protein
MMQGVRNSTVILIFSLQLKLKIALRNCGYNLHALMHAKGSERPIFSIYSKPGLGRAWI